MCGLTGASKADAAMGAATAPAAGSTLEDVKAESLPELPPMPPGWKPGDPLPELPPMPPGMLQSSVWHQRRCQKLVAFPSAAMPFYSQLLWSQHNNVCKLAGWRPGDPIPDIAPAGSGTAEAAPKAARPASDTEQATEVPQDSQQEKKERLPSSNPAFDFILNPDWEAVEEDFSDEGSE